MAGTNVIPFVLATWFVCAQVTSAALNCYDCRSDTDPGCGVTFDATQSQKEEYQKDCSIEHGDKAKECKKLISKEFDKILVIRSCHESAAANSTLDQTKKCKKYTKYDVCYCNAKGTTPCNGHTPLIYDVTMMFCVLLFGLFIGKF